MSTIKKSKLIITAGIPGSGKSFWAKQYQKDNPDTIRINNDELRETFFGRIFDEKDTPILNKIRSVLEYNFLKNFKDIIIDNCNVKAYYHMYYLDLASTWGYELIVKDFSAVPIQMCLDRNKIRGREVPEKVIYGMKSSLDSLMKDYYGNEENRKRVTFW